MRRFYILMIAMFVVLGMCAQSERTVNVAAAGTLDNYISAADKYSITKLTITGELNGKDMVLLRDMAGAKGVNTLTDGKLSELDLSGAHIVASDDVYFVYGDLTCKSENEVIGSYMFLYCDKLTKLVLPVGLKKIGDMALGGTSLSEIDIPETVTEIGEAAFSTCDKIKRIVVPNSVTVVGVGAFQRMEGLEEIVYGNGLTELDLSNIMGDTSLKSVSVGTGMTALDAVMFNGLSSLESIQVAEGNPNIASVDGVLTSADKSELLFYPSGKPGDTYAIPDGVRTVKQGAFSGTTHLTTINIPKTVTEIESGAFGSAMALTGFVIDKENPKYTVADNMLYTKDLSTLVCVPTMLQVDTYITPASVEHIGGLAFAGNASIREIYLTDNVKTVGESAFSFCRGLEKLVLGKGISSIGEGVCAGDEKLTAVYCYADDLTDEKVDVFAFYDEYLMEQCTLYVPKGLIDFYDAQMWVHYIEEGEALVFFADIQEMDEAATGISDVEGNSAYPVSVYSVDGKLLDKPQKGLSIIKMSDGSVRKILTK
ncbi:MAG: leucine-rich repeat domain-containing protein [Prevotella sp.]|nr:leucine-rich repeat domain-containing protein [Prevotella sp.]